AALKARIADSNVRLGNFAAAVKYEKAAISLAPQWSGPPYVLAFSLARLGRTPEAVIAANKSCELGFHAACDLLKELREPIRPSDSQRETSPEPDKSRSAEPVINVEPNSVVSSNLSNSEAAEIAKDRLAFAISSATIGNEPGTRLPFIAI